MTDSAARPRILVVDDEENLCAFMKLMLAKEGYDVVTTVSAREALDLLSDDGMDLVFTDLMMPEMSGLDLVKKLREMRPETECVVMTAYASVDSAIEALKLGAADYIPKPFDLEYLDQAVSIQLTASPDS